MGGAKGFAAVVGAIMLATLLMISRRLTSLSLATPRAEARR